MKKILSFITIGVLLLVLILVVLVGQNGGSTDLRSRAWSGVTTNTEAIRARLGGLTVRGDVKTDPNPVKKERVSTTSALDLQRLFTSLTRTYYNAEVQNISVPTLNIRGVAFLAYDPGINATFIYSRIERMPESLIGWLGLWLEGSDGTYRPAGIAEFIREKDEPVSYSVYTGRGDLRRDHRALIFSYDSDIREAGPEAQVLRLAL